MLDVDPVAVPGRRRDEELVASARAPYRSEIDRVIGTTKTPLVRYYVLETPMDNLITDALQWKFQPDFAVSNGFRFCPPLVADRAGEAAISNEFLWSMLPVDSVLKSGVVSGSRSWTGSRRSWNTHLRKMRRSGSVDGSCGSKAWRLPSSRAIATESAFALRK